MTTMMIAIQMNMEMDMVMAMEIHTMKMRHSYRVSECKIYI